MKVFAAAALAVFSLFPFVPALADEAPTYTGPLSPSEEQFVQSVKTDLLARFPHASDAEKAGYVRYTSPDDTGAISYADKKWNSDPTHPSQLWYDTSGNLMGADFSVPRPNGEPRPQLWGINPGRWYEFNGHVHYVITDQRQDGLRPVGLESRFCKCGRRISTRLRPIPLSNWEKCRVRITSRRSSTCRRSGTSSFGYCRMPRGRFIGKLSGQHPFDVVERLAQVAAPVGELFVRVEHPARHLMANRP